MDFISKMSNLHSEYDNSNHHFLDIIVPEYEGEEFIYVMEGVVEIAYGKTTYTLNEGDSIFYDSIVNHHVHGGNNKAAKILAVVYTPF